jgi:hypothetical protein
MEIKIKIVGSIDEKIIDSLSTTFYSLHSPEFCEAAFETEQLINA